MTDRIILMPLSAADIALVEMVFRPGVQYLTDYDPADD